MRRRIEPLPVHNRYAEEGLYDRLLLWVLDCHSIAVLSRCAAQLAQFYPEEFWTAMNPA